MRFEVIGNERAIVLLQLVSCSGQLVFRCSFSRKRTLGHTDSEWTFPIRRESGTDAATWIRLLVLAADHAGRQSRATAFCVEQRLRLGTV